MTIAHGAYGHHQRPTVLPAPPSAISHLQRLRSEALDVITAAGGRTDEPARAFFLRGLDDEHPETTRRAWDAAVADYEAQHPARVLPLLDALREGAEIETDGDASRVVIDDEDDLS